MSKVKLCGWRVVILNHPSIQTVKLESGFATIIARDEMLPRSHPTSMFFRQTWLWYV